MHRNEFDRACFQHMAYGGFKDLAIRTDSDKILRDKTFSTAKNPKYDKYQRGLASMVCKFLDKKSKCTGINNEIKQNEQLAEELHKEVIKKVKGRNVY